MQACVSIPVAKPVDKFKKRISLDFIGFTFSFQHFDLINFRILANTVYKDVGLGFKFVEGTAIREQFRLYFFQLLFVRFHLS